MQGEHLDGIYFRISLELVYLVGIWENRLVFTAGLDPQDFLE